jgi:hypothetical protein
MLGHLDAYTNNIVVFRFFLEQPHIPCDLSVFYPLLFFPYCIAY